MCAAHSVGILSAPQAAARGGTTEESPITTVIGFVAVIVFFIALVWFAVREARKDRELEAKLTPEELMKKRVIEGNGSGPI